MKLFLVTILVALFCATASARATPRLSLRELILSIPLKDLDEMRVKYASNLKCVVGVADEIFASDVELVKLWEEVKANAADFVENDVQKCLAIEDGDEHLKCKEGLLTHGADIFFKIGLEFNTPPRQAMIVQLRKTLLKKCMDIKAIVSLLLKLNQYKGLESLPEIVTEYASILGDISKTHGLESEWSKVEASVQPHLTNWNKCSSKGNPLLVAYCHVKEGRATVKILADYTDAAGEKNPQFTTDVLNEVRKRWFS